MRRLIGSIVMLMGVAAVCWPVTAEEKSITIGTAGEQGVYYPAGGAICRLVERGFKEHHMRCSAEPTSGSVYNLKALRDGSLDMAFAQADWVYRAYHGSHDFSDGRGYQDLRSVLSLHTEIFTVLARADSGITTAWDLQGKRVGIGDDGSGMRATAEEFIRAEGWSNGSFAALLSLKPAEQGRALCSGRVDALLFANGHPNGSTQEISNTCKTRIIAVEGPPIDRLVRDNPYYSHVRLPGGMYRGSPHAINTFGAKAELVTSAAMPEEMVYQLVKAVFDNLDDFKTLHPVFATLDKAHMPKGTSAPLHPGALRYYREAGLVKK